MAVFKNGEEETQAIVIGAAVALHALVAGRAGAAVGSSAVGSHEQLVSQAFAISREFWKQANQEIGS